MKFVLCTLRSGLSGRSVVAAVRMNTFPEEEHNEEEEVEWGLPPGPPPEIRVPFGQKPRREFGERIFDNRETICITVIAYLMVAILLLTWGLYGASSLTGLLLAGAREEIQHNLTLRSVLVKVYKVVVVLLGVLMAAQELGLTLSLAAQDTASNLFSGMMILVERPFQIGDWVVIGDIEGTVEDISFRSTRIRALDNSLYILTNSDVCSSTINNGTQRTKRLYRFTLGVEYGATRAQLEKLMDDLRAMLAASPHTYEDSVIVEVSGFGASSIDLLVSAYVRTPSANEFYRMRNDLNLALMDIVRADGLDFAFPSTTVYIRDGAADTSKT